jgi:prephenate dehydratase
MTKDPKNIIAFQGAPGAHSDLACRQAYPYMDTLACASFEDVFNAVAEGKAGLGLIPIENSQAGRVAEIHNILPRTNLNIVGEYFQKIEHHLVAPKGATLDSIKTVYSHPQALMQCRNNLRELGLETEPYSNTAMAAKHVGEWADTSKAALASTLAATLYDLEVVKEDMQDADDNTTLFVTLSKEPIDPNPKDGQVITTLLFTIRNIPSGLYKSLGGFATNAVNLLKLESYIPAGTTSKSAQFFVTFEGSPEEKPVQLAMEELGFFTKDVKVLGVYTADKSRFN